MKKFSFLIVCLCAGLTFVSQAQDTERIAPTSGDAPSLNGGRPSPWERPIGPGPVDHPNGGSGSGDVTDDDGSGGSPLDGLTKAIVRPGTNPNVAMGKCSGSSGSPMVYDVAEVLVGGFASVPDVNGDGKIDVNDFDAMFDLLLNEQ